MRKIIIATLCLLCTLCAVGQRVAPIELEYLPQWHRTLPTVINNHNGYFLRPIESATGFLGPDGKIPPLTCISKVNGIDVEEMPVEEIYDIFAQIDTIELEVVFLDDCTTNTLAFVQQNNTGGYGDMKSFPKAYLELCDYKLGRVNGFPKGTSIMAVDTLCYNDILTYDIMVTGNDTFTDTKLLEKFCESGFFKHLTRDQEDPDIIVCVSKNSSESITQTYVPATRRVVTTTSRVTRPLHRHYSRSHGKHVVPRHAHHHSSLAPLTTTTEIITRGGYTQNNLNTSYALEFTILDARKMSDPEQTVAPVIWQMSYSNAAINRNFEVIDQYLAMASNNPFPFTYNALRRVPGVFWGCFVDNDKTVVSVVPDSEADKAGLKIGDKIDKIVTDQVRTYRNPNSWDDSYSTDTEKLKHPYIWQHVAGFYADKDVYARVSENSSDKSLTSCFNYDYSGFDWELKKLTVIRDGKKVNLTGKLPFHIDFGPLGIHNKQSYYVVNTPYSK